MASFPIRILLSVVFVLRLGVWSKAQPGPYPEHDLGSPERAAAHREIP